MIALPSWNPPRELAVGKLGVLELREEDPAQPALPRPGEDRLGPLAVRGVEAMRDGHGWRITVQPMAPGVAVIPPQDLGDGRRTPELRLTIPRTVAYGSPWVGIGGGRQDLLPYLEFPWAWATVLAVPLAVLAWLVLRARRRGLPARRRGAARRAFIGHWPPANRQRATLDAAHAAGRDLLAATFGDEARSWGAETFQQRRLQPWAVWIRSLDAARFALDEPPFPPLAELLAALERP
jgi:hypothetical protein